MDHPVYLLLIKLLIMNHFNEIYYFKLFFNLGKSWCKIVINYSKIEKLSLNCAK